MEKSNDKKNERERERFVRETVVSSKNRGKHIAKRIAGVVLSALVFGVLAAFIFVLARPFMESRFGGGDTLPPEPVTIFVSATAESSSETTTEESTQSTQETEQPENDDDYFAAWEALKPRVDEEIDEKTYEITNRDAIAKQRQSLISSVNRSIVTVSAHNAATDWFDKSVTHEEEQSGVIIATTAREILILTDADILSEHQQLYAVFANALQMPASLKAVDNTFKIAVLSVNQSAWTQEQKEGISPILPGSSSTVNQGQTVLAMGAPMGGVRSVLTGSISYISSNVQGADVSLRLLQTDISCPESANGFLVNLDGQLVGWITHSFSENQNEGFISAIALYDLSRSIEALSNGDSPALLGILGQTVTPAVAAKHKLSQGIYINRCIPNTPADRAGVQNGDILTAIGGKEISTFRDFSAILAEHSPGDAVILRIERMIEGEYRQLELAAQLEAR